jgi:hypothetical protein
MQHPDNQRAMTLSVPVTGPTVTECAVDFNTLAYTEIFEEAGTHVMIVVKPCLLLEQNMTASSVTREYLSEILSSLKKME